VSTNSGPPFPDAKIWVAGGLSVDQRGEWGRSRRSVLPRSALGELLDTCQRPDPVTLLQSQTLSRIAELVPIRYGRMLASPFAFFPGATLIMASDLAAGPDTGLSTQLCGDAHLYNVRLTGTQPGVRHQRLRRDPARTLGMGPQAPRVQPRGRRV
jgi:hypothetical protein